MENFFSPVRFSHHIYPKFSAYLLLNRTNAHPNMLTNLETMFQEIFEFPDKD